MNPEVVEYIGFLGLQKHKWHPNNVLAPEGILCLGIVKTDHQLILQVIKPSDPCDDENTWLSTDDAGWGGPVRWVKAWCRIQPTTE